MISCVLALICGFAIIGADQLTKHYIISNFLLGESKDFLKGLINIVYVENRGAAWGMMSGKTWILLGFTSVVMIGCIAIMIKIGRKNPLLFWALSFVVSGGLGNLIDRAFRKGVVVDFLQFDFWQDFPVFNVADCAIVIGGGLIVLYYIIDFVNEYKQKQKTEEELQQVNDENN